MELLDKFLREVNPYYHAYKQMHEIEKDQELRNLKEGVPMKTVSMFFKNNSSDDIRRYNIPKIGEVAVVFNGEDGEPSTSELMVYPKYNSTNNFDKNTNSNFHLKNIKVINPNCDPMVYPIFFFYGEPGWRPGMEHNPKTK
jgi:hypothetical protein